MANFPLDEFDKQDIKSNRITPSQLEEMYSLSGSYESLFSKRSMQYKALDLASKTLTENDFKNYILEEYTFLKRPVFIIENEIFIGNSKKEIEKVEQKLNA